ncbi:50S ribosomal protein L13 [candidate division KSB1 bacterium]|nr:50S ribosomal protein L13 [candidate division KSB1 bacterium]
MKTYIPKVSEIKKDWFIVDAEGLTLGRLASNIAQILRGKHKPMFTPHMDTGDFVIVVNAEKIVVTGKKTQEKLYSRFTGYPGGLRQVSFDDLIRNHPERIVTKAVWGMLPHNRLGRKVIKHLKVYAGAEHPHQAQQPQEMKF